jgi:hypothetical protein
MAVTLIIAGRVSAVTAVTAFAWPGPNLSTNTTESIRLRPIRSAGTFLSWYTQVDATGTGRSLRLRKNGANGNLVISFTDTTAGTFSDLTHSDHFAVGDTFDVEILGSTPYTLFAHALLFSADSGTVGVYANANSGTTPASTAWCSLSGNNWIATEAAAQFLIRAPATYQNVVCTVVTAPGANNTLTSRKNGVAGNVSITLTSGVTGIFEDTTHSDSVVAGDSYYFQLAGNNTMDFAVGATAIHSGVTSEVYGPCGVNINFSAATRFVQLSTNNEATAAGTEAQSQTVMPIAGSFSNSRIGVTTNTFTGTWTRTLRINGVNGNQVLTVGAGATGTFEDTTNIDIFKVGDLINFAEAGGTANSLAMNWSGLTLNPAPPNVLFAAFELTPSPASSRLPTNRKNHIQQPDFQEFISPVPVIIENQFFGNDFYIWPNAPKPINRAKDWIAFSSDIIVGVPSFFTFMPFDPAQRPRNFARDWIAFSGNVFVETFPPPFNFLNFASGLHSKNFSKDWIAYSGNEQIEDFPRIGIDFLTFSKGLTAKPFGNSHQPQWWTYEIKAQFFPKRDTHDGLRRHRHPSVYSEEYYESLKEKKPPRERRKKKKFVPNLLIPLKGIIKAQILPTLTILPPYRPVPSLTIAPPEFRMATLEEIEADDEFIIRMLLEE